MPSVLHKSSVAVWEYSSSKTFTVYNIAVVITQEVEETGKICAWTIAAKTIF